MCRSGIDSIFELDPGNREQLYARSLQFVAARAGLDPTKFDLKAFRPTYTKGMLRKGFDVRLVQQWLGHKSLETTIRYLTPATDVHDESDLVTIPSLCKADVASRKSAARELVRLLSNGRDM